MSRLALRPLVLALLVFVCVATAGAVNFTTQDFGFHAQITKDGSLLVREEIALTFTQAQHGIVRKIPFRTADSAGNVRTIACQLEKVEQSVDSTWESAEAVESYEDGNYKIRIGSSDRTFEGQVRYRIRYKVTGALTPIEKHDRFGPRVELLWNALGSWPTSVQDVSGEVSYPKPTSNKLFARILLGPRGTRRGIQIDQDNRTIGNSGLVEARFGDSELTFRTLRPVDHGESLTFSLALPKGTVQPSLPTIERTSQSGWIPVGGNDRPPMSIPQIPALMFLPLLALPIVYSVTRKRWAPPAKPMVVRFDPPPGVDAPLCGKLMDNRVDRRDIVAGIVNLAQKGAIRMHHTTDGGNGVDLELLDRPRQPLDTFETALFESLRPYGPVVTPLALRGTFGNAYQSLARTLESIAHGEGYYDDRGAAPSSLGCALTLFGMATGWAAIVFGGIPAILALVVTFVAGFWMISRINPLTQKGMDARWQLQGLYEFISRAHERELNYMAQKAPDQALFENLLPYAIAFDLVNQWTQAFEGIELMPPDWYVGDPSYDPTSMIWTAMMVDDLTRFDDTYGSAMTYVEPTSFGTGGSFSSGDSGFGSGFDSSGGGFDSSSGSFDSGSDAGGGGGGGGADSW